MNIVVAGGGAAGFFAAIACAEANPACEVTLLEKSPELLAKVTISGGGRCNVTHACFDADELVKNYPRGCQELIGPFYRWQPQDTVAWFESRGVPLKIEDDGRMFPVTDQSTTITDCLIKEAKKARVNILNRKGIAEVQVKRDRFILGLTSREIWECDKLLLATGGNIQSKGFEIAASLGHTIEELCPSLFTFNLSDSRIRELQGVAVSDVEVQVIDTKLKQRGPLLITHWGLSGPAILKLSAWGARILHDLHYEFNLNINWIPGFSWEQMESKLTEIKTGQPGKTVFSFSPLGLPQRLWRSLVLHAGIDEKATWGGLSKKSMFVLFHEIVHGTYLVKGKSLFKEEFVTCGGVRLKEVDFRTMESKKCKNLYFAGEILDIDGVTGGFNFQAAWTTGWIAGQAMAIECSGSV